MMKREDIQIRDPFIFRDDRSKTYYLYGTTDPNCWDGICTGFDGYRSKDLKTFEGPFPVFRAPAGFWADRNFWAPEVHFYNGKYYMLASFKASGFCRATQALVSDTLDGPFFPAGESALTPSEWECLDGTLYVDKQETPWLIFSHEWIQCHVGEVCAMQLESDMSCAKAETLQILFRATDAPWVTCHTFAINNENNGKSGFVTDGPFLFHDNNGELLMLWSSFGQEGYAIGLARSKSGEITGPWEQEEQPLFKKDGGHAMIFKTFEGNRLLTMHMPNIVSAERPQFFELIETNGRFGLKEWNPNESN